MLAGDITETENPTMIIFVYFLHWFAWVAATTWMIELKVCCPNSAPETVPAVVAVHITMSSLKRWPKMLVGRCAIVDRL